MPQAGSGFPQADCRPWRRTVSRRRGHANNRLISADPFLLPRCQEIAETDPPEKLGANPIGDRRLRDAKLARHFMRAAVMACHLCKQVAHATHHLITFVGGIFDYLDVKRWATSHG